MVTLVTGAGGDVVDDSALGVGTTEARARVHTVKS